jgi:hypothetical protein
MTRLPASSSGSADVENWRSQILGRSVGVLLAQVGQQDVLACADTPGDGLAYLAGSYDDDTSVTAASLLRSPAGAGW